MATTILSGTIVPEVLGNNNYETWRGCIKNYLLAQDLWDIIETTTEPPKPEDGVVEFKAWRKRNAATLHAIHISCGMDIQSQIKDISSAKILWDTLANLHEQPAQVVGNSSSSTGNNFQTTWYIQYKELYYALQWGDLHAANDFITQHPNLVREKITHLGQTVLHVAVLAHKKEIVKLLVEKKMSKVDLEIRDNEGRTALDLTIILGYELQLVALIIDKNRELVTVGNNQGFDIPIVLALRHERTELATYLFALTPFDELQPEISATVVTKAIHTGNYDIASRLIWSFPDLAFTRDTDNVFPFSVFFGTTSLLLSTLKLQQAESNKWSQLLRVLHISSPREKFLKYLLDKRNKPGEAGTAMGSDQMQSIQTQYEELLSAMLGSIDWVTANEIQIYSRVVQAIFGAVRAGMIEFIGLVAVKFISRDVLYGARDDKRRNVLMSAVQHRQPEIFGLIYIRLNKYKATSISSRDDEGNNILHVAGTLTEFSPLDHITGAALKMQTELQWFQAVEGLCNPMYRNERNYYGLTPKQVFTQTHKELMKEGERWMKDTSTSCTVVGALIVTIMFAAAFAVPGGNNQNTGFPIFLNRKLFKIFIIADSLSLFSSSISVLMFLGILTSRYEAEQFRISLPTKMIIGLSTLFFSIATMMIAFSCAILMMMRGESWIVIPLIGLAAVPVSIYVIIQSRVLVDMIFSTYGSGTIYRKINQGMREYKAITTMWVI